MRLLNLIIALVLSGTAFAANPTPVMVGGNESTDACMTLGAIKNSPGGKVNVYSSPDEDSVVIDSLKSGTYIMLCDSSGDNWTGIVYSGDDAPFCGVTSPIESRQPYKGECKSGWMKSRMIDLLAG